MLAIKESIDDGLGCCKDASHMHMYVLAAVPFDLRVTGEEAAGSGFRSPPRMLKVRQRCLLGSMTLQLCSALQVLMFGLSPGLELSWRSSIVCCQSCHRAFQSRGSIRVLDVIESEAFDRDDPEVCKWSRCDMVHATTDHMC